MKLPALSIPQFLLNNPMWEKDSPDDAPRTLLDWRRIKLVMKACCDHRKSSPKDREKLYNTLQRINLMIQSKGDDNNMIWFKSKSEKFCKVVGKPVPEYRCRMTKEEIQSI